MKTTDKSKCLMEFNALLVRQNRVVFRIAKMIEKLYAGTIAGEYGDTC